MFFRPTKIEFPGAVRELVGGRNHLLALTSDGALYVWGTHISGELGLGYNIPRYEPTLHPLPNVVEIACGMFHSFVITKDGELYAFGSGERCPSEFLTKGG
jgi:alpha-tubulin suppressor-like RCC1 family protein